MNTDPAQVAEHRHKQRADMHVEQRRVMALELIADTLEAIRLDLAEAIVMLGPSARTSRHN